MKGPRNPLLAVIFVFAFSALGFSSAANVYITPDGSSQGACTTNPQPPAWFNSPSNWGSGSSQIGPGTTVTICGTFTGAAGSTEFAFQGSGSSGSPITLLFDAGAELNAPYWPSNGGAINTNRKGFLVINGGTNGVIQNTANGDGLAYQQISAGVNAFGCSNCTIENLTITNIYVAIRNYGNPLGGNATQMNAITYSGQNGVISGNTIHDCGWCLYLSYANNDTNLQVFNNEVYNWGHAVLFATGGANTCTAPCLFFHDNRIHDNLNWETAGCVYHNDGIHFFGQGGSMSGIYVYNNWFYGSLSGLCSSGFIFMEGGSGTPSNASNTYWWNNVFDASGTDSINQNGWVGIFSGVSGVTYFVANTMVGANGTDNDVCYNIGSVNNLTFEDNVVNNCGIQIKLGSLTGSSAVDYNVYGNSCQNRGNCFAWNNSYKANFTNWKSATSFDSHSIFNLTPNMNQNGTPRPNYVGIQQGIDLASAATGNLATLSSDTTQGNTRTPLLRPTGTCTTQGSGTCWDIGAYQYSATIPPDPPTGLTAIVK